MSASVVRVGVDARSLYAQRRRGIGKTLLQLYEELVRRTPDWRFFLYFERHARSFRPWATLPDNVHERPLPDGGYRLGLWHNVWLPLCARLDRIDVLHCPAQFAPPRSHAPVVLTVHDVIPIVCPGEVSAQRARRFRETITQSVKRATHIIAISQHSLADLRREIPEARARDSSVIPWGLQPAPCPPQAKNAARASRMLLAFGGDAYRKNVPRLVEAFAAAQALNPGWRLVVTGLPDHTRTSLCAQFSDYSSILELRGYVDEGTLEALLLQAEAFVFPSLYEGFGVPLLEAMAAGTPVLVADNSSLPEVAGAAAMYFDGESVESISGILSRFMRLDASQKSVMSLRGCERLQQFSIHTTAEKTREVLKHASRRPH